MHCRSHSLAYPYEAPSFFPLYRPVSSDLGQLDHTLPLTHHRAPDRGSCPGPSRGAVPFSGSQPRTHVTMRSHCGDPSPRVAPPSTQLRSLPRTPRCTRRSPSHPAVATSRPPSPVGRRYRSPLTYVSTLLLPPPAPLPPRPGHSHVLVPGSVSPHPLAASTRAAAACCLASSTYVRSGVHLVPPYPRLGVSRLDSI